MGFSLHVRFVFIELLVLTILSLPVHAMVREAMWITPKEDGSAHVKFMTSFIAPLGYSYPELNFNDYFLVEDRNIVIHDGGMNKFSKRLVSSDSNGTLYNITIYDVNDTSPYYLYYEYDYHNAIMRYGENYHLKVYAFTPDKTIPRQIKFCKPKGSKESVPYDSTPKEGSDFISYKLKFTSTSFLLRPPESEVGKIDYSDPGFCTDGMMEDLVGMGSTVDLYEVKYSIKGQDVGIEIYNGNKLRISVPSPYKNNLIYIKDAEKAIPIVKGMKFKLPEKISIFMVDENDAVLDIKKEKDLACYTDGQCFVTLGIFRNNPEIQLINIVKTIVLSGSVNTYGETIDNWWQDGASNQLTLTAMKQAGLSILEFQRIIKDATENLSSDDLMTVDLDLVYTKVVDEMEQLCPDHITKINEYMNGATPSFDEVKKFNNFLIFAFAESCSGKDVSSILEKYKFEFDNVMGLKKRYDDLNNNTRGIPEEISTNSIIDFKSKVDAIYGLFRAGDVDEVANRITNLNSVYKDKIESMIKLIQKYIKVKNNISNPSGLNLFRGDARDHLEKAKQEFISGDLVGTDKELDLAMTALNRGKIVTGVVMISLTVILVVGGAILIMLIRHKRRKHMRHSRNE